jgi:hypothetical protein
MKSIDGILYADEGKMLTNGATVYADFLRLGDWDSENNYTEITKEEHEKKMAEQEALMEVDAYDRAGT